MYDQQQDACAELYTLDIALRFAESAKLANLCEGVAAGRISLDTIHARLKGLAETFLRLEEARLGGVHEQVRGLVHEAFTPQRLIDEALFAIGWYDGVFGNMPEVRSPTKFRRPSAMEEMFQQTDREILDEIDESVAIASDPTWLDEAVAQLDYDDPDEASAAAMAVHNAAPEPATTEEPEMTKVRLVDDDGDAESVWAEVVDREEGIYRIRNHPLDVRVNLDDLVIAEPVAGMLTFVRLHKPSGNTMLIVIFNKAAVGRESHEKVHEEVQRRNHAYEGYMAHLGAITLPVDASESMCAWLMDQSYVDRVKQKPTDG